MHKLVDLSVEKSLLAANEELAHENLHRLEHRGIRFLQYTASVSFAIYFLHPWLLRCFGHRISDAMAGIRGGLIFPVKAALAVGVSMAIASALRKLLRGKSRYFIGY